MWPGFRAIQEPLAYKVQRALPVLLVPQVYRAAQELQVALELPECKVPPDYKAQLVRQVQQGLRALSVLQVIPVQLVPWVLREQQVLPGQLASPA